MVKLEKITPDNYRECLDLSVSEEQKEFVSSNLLSLAKAYVFYNSVTPFAIYDDSLMLGFIMLRFYEELDAYFIWEFMIDEKYQFKGYGRQALELAIKWMKSDSKCHKILTTYIVGNEKAKQLYIKHGFQQLGEEEEGEVNMVLYV